MMPAHARPLDAGKAGLRCDTQSRRRVSSQNRISCLTPPQQQQQKRATWKNGGWLGGGGGVKAVVCRMGGGGGGQGRVKASEERGEEGTH